MTIRSARGNTVCMYVHCTVTVTWERCFIDYWEGLETEGSEELNFVFA